jgi:hypothetical protein
MRSIAIVGLMLVVAPPAHAARLPVLTTAARPLGHSDGIGADTLGSDFAPIVDGSASFWLTSFDGFIGVLPELPAEFRFLGIEESGFAMPDIAAPWVELRKSNAITFRFVKHALQHTQLDRGFLHVLVWASDDGSPPRNAFAQYKTPFVLAPEPRGAGLLGCLLGVVAFRRRLRAVK